MKLVAVIALALGLSACGKSSESTNNLKGQNISILTERYGQPASKSGNTYVWVYNCKSYFAPGLGPSGSITVTTDGQDKIVSSAENSCSY